MKRLLCVIGALIVGLAACQLPAFDQQYTQRLGGAVDELAVIAQRFDASAQASGLSRTQAFERYAAAGEPFLVAQGADMARTLARYERLSAHLAAIRTANSLERTLDLTRYYDVEIGTRTLETFEPALPATLEGLGFLAAGFVVGYGVFSLLLGAIALPFRRRRALHR